MLETISKGFRQARDLLAGQATLTEENIDQALRDVRMSLLEADVEFKVTKDFLARIKERALGESVKLRARAKGKKVSVSPGEHFVKICNQELTQLMGPVQTDLEFAKRGPTGIMMVGLQGSGKTTSAGKLARYLEKKKKSVLLVAADVYRPAAIEQLKILGTRLGMPVYAEDSGDPPGICERAVQHAIQLGRDTIIFDTAGRLAIDEPLMHELEEIKLRTQPANILLVVDAMMGQDAVNIAATFHQRLDLSGVILTKLDGDARGGAALSVKAVTGAPIKFLGMGESLDQLEEFRPEGMASRILGMGDIVGLMKDFEEVVDAEEAEQDAMRMLRGSFDMHDFLKQIRMIQKMGSLADLFDKLPFFPNGLPDGMNLDDRELVRVEAMINSMTNQERSHPEVLVDGQGFDESRVRRIAQGSGRSESDVSGLLNKFGMMRQVMMQMGANAGLLGKIPGLKQLSQMKQLAGIDMDQLMAMSGLAPPGGEARRAIRPQMSPFARAKAKKKKKSERQARKASRR